MKPWEQIWEADIRGDYGFVQTGNGIIREEMDADDAHLIAAAPELYLALCNVEWSGGVQDGIDSGTAACCPSCGALADKGQHEPDCELAMVLRKARGET